MAPEAVAAEFGWQVLAWVGDHFQIPTVGVPSTHPHRPGRPAVQPSFAPIAGVQVIHPIPHDCPAHVDVLGRHTADESTPTTSLIEPYYTTDGRSISPSRRRHRRGRRRARRAGSVSAGEFYRTGKENS